LIIDDPAAVSWADSADVVVVGYGGAGVVAALRAKEQGADVLAIDRFDGGGATAYSGGVIYAGATAYQQSAGVKDTVEEMFKYLQEEGKGVVSDETLMRFCRASSDYVNWLSGYGVKYEGSLYNEKATYPPAGKFLYFSGNERVPHYKAIATPAPRGHRTVGEGLTGNVYYAALRRAADAAGVRTLTHAPAVRLVVDRSNRVVGVEVNAIPEEQQAKHRGFFDAVRPLQPFSAARKAAAITKSGEFERRVGRPRLVRARSGVILSAGGFINNPELVEKQLPFLKQNYRALTRLGSLGCDGSGIALGQSVGGYVDHMDAAFLARTIAPPGDFLYGIIVNVEGKRFVNEDAYTGVLGRAIALQPGGKAWLIVKSEVVVPGVRGLLRWGWVAGGPLLLNYLFGGTRSARSAAALGRKIGLPKGALDSTIAEYDREATSGGDDGLGKNRDYMRPFESGRLTAINLATGNPFSFTLAFTLGGLVVDEATGAVKTKDGSPIKGLYAAGRTAVGMCSAGYISGMAIADTVFSGRRAAESILQRSN
jgi:3-oxo-5alpha-steroid 4-dehydrogenase